MAPEISLASLPQPQGGVTPFPTRVNSHLAHKPNDVASGYVASTLWARFDFAEGAYVMEFRFESLDGEAPERLRAQYLRQLSRMNELVQERKLGPFWAWQPLAETLDDVAQHRVRFPFIEGMRLDSMVREAELSSNPHLGLGIHTYIRGLHEVGDLAAEQDLHAKIDGTQVDFPRNQIDLTYPLYLPGLFVRQEQRGQGVAALHRSLWEDGIDGFEINPTDVWMKSDSGELVFWLAPQN